MYPRHGTTLKSDNIYNKKKIKYPLAGAFVIETRAILTPPAKTACRKGSAAVDRLQHRG
jgi:hypothetical protein